MLNATDLANMLAATDVRVVPGKKASDIDVTAAVAWGSAHRLTLDAYRSIGFEQQLAVQGTGGLTMTTNDGGSGGTLSFSSPGSVTFWDLSSSLVINGNTYTLVGSVAALGAGIKAAPSGDFALAANYDATPDGTYKAAPVKEFSGIFEGLGNTISNLMIAIKKAGTADPWLGEAGLFGIVDAAGIVEDISVTDAKVSGGDQMNSGILVARLFGTVANCFSSGTSSAGNGIVGSPPSADVGGLVGAMGGAAAVIVNSSSTASATAGTFSFAGGRWSAAITRADRFSIPPRAGRRRSASTALRRAV